MKLIVGLGNPGKKYENTRHNIGFMVIDKVAANFKSIFNAEISKKIIKDQKIILAKPRTFMNNSGLAVKKITDYYKIKPENIVVIHDDIDLPLGEIRVQQNRNSAGHKGVQSIIDALGAKDFIRIRIGIRPEELKTETEKFVIQKFTQEEQKIIQKTIKEAVSLIKTAF